MDGCTPLSSGEGDSLATPADGAALANVWTEAAFAMAVRESPHDANVVLLSASNSMNVQLARAMYFSGRVEFMIVLLRLSAGSK
jgi:hypothetical protein